MNNLWTLRVLAILTLYPAFTGAAAFSAERDDIPKRPNFLFLITDQQTASALSCAGNGASIVPCIIGWSKPPIGILGKC